MTDRLVLHIGDFKTGSTSIQTVLAEGGYDGAARVHYPATTSDQRRLARLINWNSHKPQSQALYTRIAKSIRDTPADVAILSAEHFMTVDPAVLVTWLNRWLPEMAKDVQVIAYVRPHAEFLVSTWAEQTKLGVNILPLSAYVDTFLSGRATVFETRFSVWQDTFGDRFSLRPMIRAHLQDRDVVRDFLGQVLGPDLQPLPARRQLNTQLSFQDVEFLRAFHARLRVGNAKLAKAPRNLLGNRLQAALQSIGPAGDKITLTPAEVAQVQTACTADAAALDARFFDGTPLSDALMSSGDKARTRSAVIRPVKMRHLRAVARVRPAFLPRALRQALTQGL